MSTNGSVFVWSPPTLAEDTAWPLRSDVFAELSDIGFDNPRQESEIDLEQADWTAEYPADEWSETPDDFAPMDEAFPSGLELSVVTGATGAGEEHWDPNDTGLPLFDTGPAIRAKKLSTNFTVGEVVSSGGRADDRARISLALVRCLQAIRDRAGKPVRVTSGYRSWSRNVEVYRRAGKSPTHSRHCSGQAADITIAGLSGMQIAKLAVESCGDKIGIGVGKSYVHIDVRGRSTVWVYDGLDQTRVLAELEGHRKGGGMKPVKSVPTHVAEFVRTYRPHAQASETRSRVPWLVTMGQGALESGWGKQMCGNNMFGIKAKTTIPESQRKLCTTKEVHKSSNVKYPEVLSVTPRADGRYDYVVRDWFRAFASPEDSFDAHAKVLQHPRYAKAFAHSDDPYAFADEVAAGGYATAPNYAAALKNVMTLIAKVP
ncbi:MAG: glucosaminidase domain-containing protein [Mycobacterium sp.]